MSEPGIVDRFDTFLAISRRAYPIMGRVKLRLIDARQSPYKPVYLRYEILRGRSWDQSGVVREPGSGSWIWVLDLVPEASWIPVSQILEYI